ncbi:MAG: tRNA (adenosine(37)-N6)-threonylcarbamoyltransferase complex dimerization subunit type 1 TsaB [Bryobacterales bacterium]|nr:tRNA (adenosine(37)-N6)-threonylcarbamoyltransferase complex dimerization subunit type 1 TsaB [Bryobacterales bacterium]
MKILAVDTSAEFASIAALDSAGDGAELLEILLHSADGFAHQIFTHFETLLRRINWTIDQVDAFGAASGPGSFTGVRVALSAMKGLAESLGKPVIAVSNLEAIAALGASRLRAPLLDARRGEVYGAVYDRNLQIVVPETVGKFQDWLETVPAEAEFLVQDPTPFAHLLPREPRVVRRALAGAVARITRDRLQAGVPGDPVTADANYVRRADAELKWKDR